MCSTLPEKNPLAFLSPTFQVNWAPPRSGSPWTREMGTGPCRRNGGWKWPTYINIDIAHRIKRSQAFALLFVYWQWDGLGVRLCGSYQHFIRIELVWFPLCILEEEVAWVWDLPFSIIVDFHLKSGQVQLLIPLCKLTLTNSTIWHFCAPEFVSSPLTIPHSITPGRWSTEPCLLWSMEKGVSLYCCIHSNEVHVN